jgi:glycosyltransferase involved in cell wall biosynthesis/radical SAM superfamily enzyme YgiQ (UPF0313 family)
MKILMIHAHDIWSDQEPWTSRIRNIATEFARQGHCVRLIYFGFPGKMSQPQTGVPFESFRLRRSKWALFWNLFYVLKHAFWSDIIHVQKCFAHATLPAVLTHLLLNKPLHYDWDDWEYQIFNYECTNPVQSAFLDYTEKKILTMVDTLSVSSRALRHLAIQWGFPEKQIVSAHVCADLELFHPYVDGQRIREKFSLRKPVVMYMGQLHGAQYADLFIEAAAIIHAKCDVLFMLVGAGTREPILYQHIHEKGLEDVVVFTGAVAHEEVPYYLAVCDVAVACFEDNNITRYKSPLKIVEYMACAKAIVASDVGDVPYMLGKAGLLVPPGDAKELAEAIMALLEDEKKRKQLGEQARTRAEQHFAWAITANNILDAYSLARDLYRPAHRKKSRGRDAKVRTKPKRRDIYSLHTDVLLVTAPPWGVHNPPVGLAYLAHYLQVHDLCVDVFDFNIKLYNRIDPTWHKLWLPEYKNWWSNEKRFTEIVQEFASHIDWAVEKIIASCAAIIGFSVVDPKERMTIALIRRLLAKESTKRIVLGGPAVSTPVQRNIFIEQLGSAVDFYVVGEGEKALLSLTRTLKQNEFQISAEEELKKPLIFSEDIDDLDTVPFPKYGGFDFTDYIGGTMIVEWSRGCISDCAFCKGKKLLGRYRMKKAERIVDELKYHYKNNGISRFIVCDNLVNGNPAELERVCDLLIAEGLPIEWEAQGIPYSRMTAGLLNKMRESGCRKMQWGVESGSDLLLDKIGKGKIFTVQEAETVIRASHAAGIWTEIFIIIGLPGEDDIEFEKTKHFIANNHDSIDAVKSVNTLHLVQGTEVFDHAEDFGLALPEKDQYYLWKDKNGCNSYEWRVKRAQELIELVGRYNIAVHEHNLFEGKMI